MKLHISFDATNLDQALHIAHKVADYAAAFKVGLPLLYLKGVDAVKQFKKTFPDKPLIADCKISDHGKESVTLFAQAGADWVTVLAGTNVQTIHSACTTARNLNVKVLLDLIDAESAGQSALEAKNLGADALLFHRIYEESKALIFLDKWQMVRGNTDLPVYLSANITRENIQSILSQIKPDGIVVGKPITEAQDPLEEARSFSELISS